MNPRTVRTPSPSALRASDHDLLQVRDLGLAAPGARERGQDPRLVVEALDQRGHGEGRAPPVQLAEQRQGGGHRLRAGQVEGSSRSGARIHSAPPDSA